MPPLSKLCIYTCCRFSEIVNLLLHSVNHFSNLLYHGMCTQPVGYTRHGKNISSLLADAGIRFVADGWYSAPYTISVAPSSDDFSDCNSSHFNYNNKGRAYTMFIYIHTIYTIFNCLKITKGDCSSLHYRKNRNVFLLQYMYYN